METARGSDKNAANQPNEHRDNAKPQQWGQQDEAAQRQRHEEGGRKLHNIHDEQEGHKIHQWMPISQRQQSMNQSPRKDQQDQQNQQQLPTQWNRVSRQGKTPAAVADEARRGIARDPQLAGDVRKFTKFVTNDIFGENQQQQQGGEHHQQQHQQRSSNQQQHQQQQHQRGKGGDDASASGSLPPTAQQQGASR